MRTITAIFCGFHVLDLDSNQISGTLPSTWSAWTQLTLLYLQNNTVPSTRRGLTGTLPEQWQSLRALKFLNLAHNTLSGVIPPAWMTGMTNLTFLGLNDNRLRGSVPLLPRSLGKPYTTPVRPYRNNPLTIKGTRMSK